MAFSAWIFWLVSAKCFQLYSCQLIPATGTTPGRFCGILKEDPSLGNLLFHNCHGTVWALDERRLYITSFSFQPSFNNNENITFWIGPNVPQKKAIDELTPSENGLYLSPKQVPLPNPLLRKDRIITAKRPSAQQIASILFNKTLKNLTDALNLTDLIYSDHRSAPTTNLLVNDAKEPKPVAEPNPSKPIQFAKDVQIGQSDPANWLTTSEIKNDNWTWVNESLRFDLLNNTNTEGNLSDHTVVHLIVGPGVTMTVLRRVSTPSFLSLNADGSSDISLSTEVSTINANSSSTVNSSDPAGAAESKEIDRDLLPELEWSNSTDWLAMNSTDWSIDNATSTEDNTTIVATTTTAQSTTTATSSSINTTDQAEPIKSLSWYAESRPLILELPDDRKLSEFRWLSVWDHREQTSVATMLFSSDIDPPKPLVLNGFRPALTKDVRSGPIEILDSKTIRINDFHFEGDAPGAWFYVGKSLLPVASGEIVPILNNDGSYNCDFLEAIENRTLTLRLPGDLEVGDVFWLSVFCLPYAVSFAQVYLPYKDMNVPTTLEQTPAATKEDYDEFLEKRRPKDNGEDPQSLSFRLLPTVSGSDDCGKKT